MRRAYSPPATGRRGRPRGGDLDPHGAFQVGAPHLDAERLERRDDVRVRVTVPVVAPGADQPDPRSDGREERGIGGGRPVVGHGQHLDVEQVRPAELGRQREQIGLGNTLHVARDEHAPVAPGGEHHDRAVVEFAPRPAVGPPRSR
jgi:hypothetical protein